MTAMFTPAELRPPALHRADTRPHAVVIGKRLRRTCRGGQSRRARVSRDRSRAARRAGWPRLCLPRDGFIFDAGPTIVTAPFLLEYLWRLCGRRFADDVELKVLDPFYAVRSRIMTPIDFEERLLSCKDAAFGLEPALTQSAWFRPNNRSEDIRDLFLVGAGTHPGSGIPGVISSARVLDAVVPDAARFA
jgi:hypothetical protein